MESSWLGDDVGDRFQILSLDGGGIKGLFSAAVLAAVEKDLGVRVSDNFDLIAGTSTGGIIAIGLGMGMTPHEIVEFYLREGPNIFPRRGAFGPFSQWMRPKFSAEPLIAALKSALGERRFGESKKRLVIPSYSLGEDDVYIFRTPHHERLRRDFKVPAWKVALATASAPTYFPCTREVDNVRLIDGGVWANNPTMVALAESHGTLNVPLSSTWTLSLGTTDVVSARPASLDSGGVLAWARGGNALEIVLRGQTIAATNQARFLLGNRQFERLNPAVPDRVFALDEVSRANDLIAKAAHLSRHFMPVYEKKFASHTAAPFQPLYA